uniref:Site-specific DNA-methyltransferase (adenine-specific) n=1 Tax=Macrostomum lignano TaxID=282301 RepID=A0A1I8J3U2_9PLAT
MDRDGINFKYDEVTVCELKNSELQACPDKVDYLVNDPFSEQRLQQLLLITTVRHRLQSR